MNRLVLFTVFVLSVIVLCTNCGKENEEEFFSSSYIAGLTTNNYPKVDGSTSTAPLNTLIACKLFDFAWQWVGNNEFATIYTIEPDGKGSKAALWNKIKSSQTHNSIINLIDKKADLTLSARIMSPDEKAYADEKGVSLIETPIALDAFVIIVNPDNPIESLTTNQIQDIYTGKITDWNEVGVSNFPSWWSGGTIIKPFVRNPNSGSQELMELLVMKDLDIGDFEKNEFEVLFSMAGALDAVAQQYNVNSICYTVYYFLMYQASARSSVKSIAVNGIYPNMQTISNNSYPYTAEVYAVIRSDLDESSMAYKVYEWLQTEHGKQVISESGYILN